jgi:hypothetical protein
VHRTHSCTALAWLASALIAAPAARAGDVTVTLESGSDFAVEREGGNPLFRVDGDSADLRLGGALFVHTTGLLGGPGSLFVGHMAGNPDSPGFRNTGFGVYALRSNTSGYNNSAFGSQALHGNTSGGRNSAFGQRALMSNSSGLSNTAVGAEALMFNSTGSGNTAFGAGALRYGGGDNSAFGNQALWHNTGSLNSAFGPGALLSNTTGSESVAVGLAALGQNTTGSRNVAIGTFAGLFQTTGSDNIYLANQGVAAESGQIRIGTTGTHTQAHMAGIHTATSIDGIAVLVNASGTLGTTTSSARFKQDVRDMGEASDRVMKLRPVTFRYREEAVGAEGAKTPQYGLIAEEVAEVAPELVAPDADGRPYSVKYHELPSLLLNELQEQQRTIARLEARIAELERRQPRTQASR